MPVGPVDFEEHAEVGEPEVGGPDEPSVGVADGSLADIADTDEVEGTSDPVFQLGNNRHEQSVGLELPVGEVIEGDCIEVMRTFPANSVDAICCDPPYGLAFMSQEFDDPKHMEKVLSSQSSTGAGVVSKPGIGDREVGWPSNAGWNAFRCNNCNKLSHGGSPCQCEEPDFVPADNRWRVYQDWTELWAKEAYRVLKPGGHLIAFGGTRTYHRQAVGIEDAGFEVRDLLEWVYLSGMPKSRDISKDIDRMAGAEREVVGKQTVRDIRRQPGRPVGWGLNAALREKDEYIERDVTTATSDEAKQWSGYGTNLKPAHEPILLARKPLVSSVARNVLQYGTGALNIDGTRIPVKPGEEYIVNTFDEGAKPFGDAVGEAYTSRTETKGRWPSNVLLTDAEVFDDPNIGGVVGGGSRSSGVMKAGTSRNSRSIDYGKMPDVANLADTYGDSGGVSRMFIIPKAARSEKEPDFNPEALEDSNSLGPMAGRGEPGLKCRKCNRWKVSGSPCRCDEPDFEPQPFTRPKVKNDHPTVKPIDLMCHLVRLICPPGGVVLDPFLGSGTTAKAAILEGRQWVGIERDPHFAKIARSRLQGTQQGFGLE